MLFLLQVFFVEGRPPSTAMDNSIKSHLGPQLALLSAQTRKNVNCSWHFSSFSDVLILLLNAVHHDTEDTTMQQIEL